MQKQKESAMNKYYMILDKILGRGKTQSNKKGNIRYLLNERLSLSPLDLLDIVQGHNIAAGNFVMSFNCL